MAIVIEERDGCDQATKIIFEFDDETFDSAMRSTTEDPEISTSLDDISSLNLIVMHIR